MCGVQGGGGGGEALPPLCWKCKEERVEESAEGDVEADTDESDEEELEKYEVEGPEEAEGMEKLAGEGKVTSL